MYRKVSEIAEIMGMSRPTVRKIRKLIIDNPERYGAYGVAGTRLSVLAVIDACRWRDALEAGLVNDLPPFDPAAAAMYVSDVA